MTAIEKLVAALEQVARMACPGRGYSMQQIRGIANAALDEYRATQTTAEVPRCKPWCGCLSGNAPLVSCYLTALPSDNRLHAFCAVDCMLAGHPLNPEVRK